MSRSDASVIVRCDGENCPKRRIPGTPFPRRFPVETHVDLFDLGNGEWGEGTVDASLRNAGWTKVGDRDLCPECSKEANR